jgi:hypothetical protein
MCSLESRGRFLTENKSMADLAPAHTNQDHPAVLTKFWTLADWLPYLLDLNTLELSVWCILRGESPGDASH